MIQDPHRYMCRSSHSIDFPVAKVSMGLKARDPRISEHGDSTELKKAISLFNPLKLCNGTRRSHQNEALQPMDW